ncbi:MAG TPA: hypothetical protein VNY35_12500 [Solirubrobacteraceae bacterium]|nr:hypothetical protein [Solirubrobacteraceae bacterium]
MSALLCVAPALVVLLSLWLGRYPGERRILALRARTQPRRARAAVESRRSRAPSLPRGGLLLAVSLAGRGPPRLRRA